jgi:thymidine kinase
VPKSKVTKRAKVKRLARKKQKTARVHVRELADMINKLEEYGESISEDILVIDGEVFLNPTQQAAIDQILQGDKEKEDGR